MLHKLTPERLPNTQTGLIILTCTLQCVKYIGLKTDMPEGVQLTMVV